MLRFNDGVNIDTSGPLRPLRLSDGWYVVGDGMLLAAADETDARESITYLIENTPAIEIGSSKPCSSAA